MNAVTPPADRLVPGEVLGPEDPIALSPGRARLTVRVVNTADRPVQVGSHYHFAEANPGLAFDRDAAWGFRLDIPAGTSVRFEPGVARDVGLVAIGGRRVVPGLRRAAGGSLDRAAGTTPGPATPPPGGGDR